MDALRVVHLVLLSAWAGVLAVEVVIEAIGFERAAQLAAARMHFWIDVLVEIPLVVGIVASGVALAGRAWPLDRLHWIKIAAALVAIGCNQACAVIVIVRYRQRHDPARLEHHRRGVAISLVGLPFGVLAAWIGFTYFM